MIWTLPLLSPYSSSSSSSYKKSPTSPPLPLAYRTRLQKGIRKAIDKLNLTATVQDFSHEPININQALRNQIWKNVMQDELMH